MAILFTLTFQISTIPCMNVRDPPFRPWYLSVMLIWWVFVYTNVCFFYYKVTCSLMIIITRTGKLVTWSLQSLAIMIKQGTTLCNGLQGIECHHSMISNVNFFPIEQDNWEQSLRFHWSKGFEFEHNQIK